MTMLSHWLRAVWKNHIPDTNVVVNPEGSIWSPTAGDLDWCISMLQKEKQISQDWKEKRRYSCFWSHIASCSLFHLFSRVAQGGQELRKLEEVGHQCYHHFSASPSLTFHLLGQQPLSFSSRNLLLYWVGNIGWLHSHSNVSFFKKNVSLRTRMTGNEGIERKTWLYWGKMRQKADREKCHHVFYVFEWLLSTFQWAWASFILQDRNLSCMWGSWTWLSTTFQLILKCLHLLTRIF